MKQVEEAGNGAVQQLLLVHGSDGDGDAQYEVIPLAADHFVTHYEFHLVCPLELAVREELEPHEVGIVAEECRDGFIRDVTLGIEGQLVDAFPDADGLGRGFHDVAVLVAHVDFEDGVGDVNLVDSDFIAFDGLLEFFEVTGHSGGVAFTFGHGFVNCNDERIEI